MLTDRDLVITCIAAGMDARECKAREFMTGSPIAVTPDTDIEEAARIMGQEQIHRLPVVDGEDLVGMVSLGDISMALASNDNLVAQTLRRISVPTHAAASC